LTLQHGVGLIPSRNQSSQNQAMTNRLRNLTAKVNDFTNLEHLGFEGSEEVPEHRMKPPAEGIPDVVLLPNSYVTMLAFIDKHMGKYDPANAGEKERHLLAGMLDTTFDGDSTKRYEFLKGVAGEASTKKIDGRIVQVLLYDYLGVHGWNDIPSDDALFSIGTSCQQYTGCKRAAISTYRIENCLLDEAQADPPAPLL